MNATQVLLSWSGGKDSCMALRAIQSSRQYTVRALLTTVTDAYQRVSMHGVRTSLLERQAKALGLPLEKVLIPKDASNTVYEQNLVAVLQKYRDRGVRRVAFGDLFLEEVRRYREEMLAAIAMEGLFPCGAATQDTWRRSSLRRGSRR